MRAGRRIGTSTAVLATVLAGASLSPVSAPAGGATGELQVTIKTRFTEVTDVFLRDVGVDIRGLDNQVVVTAADAGDYGPYAAILAMAAATHLIRFVGYWMMARVPVTPRLRRMLDALPGSVVMATILPIVANSGPAAALGMVLVVVMMIVRRNEFLAVFVGVGAIALARAAGL